MNDTITLYYCFTLANIHLGLTVTEFEVRQEVNTVNPKLRRETLEILTSDIFKQCEVTRHISHSLAGSFWTVTIVI